MGWEWLARAVLDSAVDQTRTHHLSVASPTLRRCRVYEPHIVSDTKMCPRLMQIRCAFTGGRGMAQSCLELDPPVWKIQRAIQKLKGLQRQGGAPVPRLGLRTQTPAMCSRSVLSMCPAVFSDPARPLRLVPLSLFYRTVPSIWLKIHGVENRRRFSELIGNPAAQWIWRRLKNGYFCV